MADPDRIFDDIFRDRAEEVISLHARGEELMETERYEDAVLCYDKILDIKPEDNIAIYEKCDALNHLGRYEEGHSILDRFMKKNPKSVYAAILKSVLFTSEYRWEEGLRLVERYLRKYPYHPDMSAEKIEYLIQLDRPHEALEFANKCLAVPRKKITATHNKYIVQEFGDMDRIADLCDKRLEEGEENPFRVVMSPASSLERTDMWHASLYRYQYEILESMSLYEDALDSIAQCIKLSDDAERNQLLHNKAEMLVKVGRHDEALACYDEFLREGDSDGRVDRYRGEILLDMRRNLEAIESLKLACKKNPDDIEAGGLLANAFVYTGQFDSAMKMIKKVHKKDPDEWYATIALIYTLREKMKYKEAIAHLDRMFKLYGETDTLLRIRAEMVDSMDAKD